MKYYLDEIINFKVDDRILDKRTWRLDSDGRWYTKNLTYAACMYCMTEKDYNCLSILR